MDRNQLQKREFTIHKREGMIDDLEDAEGGMYENQTIVPKEMEEYMKGDESDDEEEEEEEEDEITSENENPYLRNRINGKKVERKTPHKEGGTNNNKEDSGNRDVIFHNDSDDEAIIWEVCIEKARELWNWMTTKKVTYLRSSLILITWIERIFAYALVLSIPFWVWQLWPVIREENQVGEIVRLAVYFVCALLIFFFTIGQKRKSLRIELLGPVEKLVIVLLLFTSSFFVWNFKRFEEKENFRLFHRIYSVDIIPLEKQNHGECTFKPRKERPWNRGDLEQIFSQCPGFMRTVDVDTVSSEKEKIIMGRFWTEYDVKIVHENIMRKRNLVCICPVMYGERFSVISIDDIKDSKGKPALLLNPRIEVINSGPRSRTVEADPTFGNEAQEIYRKDHIELHYMNRYGRQKVRMLRGIKSHCVQSCMEKMYPFGERPIEKEE